MTIMVPVLVPPVAVGRRPTLVEPVAATEVARMGVSQLWATLLPAGANVASFRDRLLQPG